MKFLELFDILTVYQKALDAIWKPEGWNYAQLGNVIPHLHFHFIPRYRGKRVFEDVTFIDKRWGKNYAPAPQRRENKELNNKINLQSKRLCLILCETRDDERMGFDRCEAYFFRKYWYTMIWSKQSGKKYKHNHFPTTVSKWL